MSSYKNSLENYKCALELVKEDRDCYNVLESVRSTFMSIHKRIKIVQLILILFSIIAFICAGIVLWRSLSGRFSYNIVFICIGVCLGTIWIFIHGMFTSISWNWDYKVLNDDTLEYINSTIKNKYSIENIADKYKLLFKNGKCYIYYTDLGVVEDKGVFEKGNCKLECRKYYVLHKDYNMCVKQELAIVDSKKG